MIGKHTFLSFPYFLWVSGHGYYSGSNSLYDFKIDLKNMGL